MRDKGSRVFWLTFGATLLATVLGLLLYDQVKDVPHSAATALRSGRFKDALASIGHSLWAPVGIPRIITVLLFALMVAVLWNRFKAYRRVQLIATPQVTPKPLTGGDLTEQPPSTPPVVDLPTQQSGRRITGITIEEIMQSVKGAPPLQVATVSKQYEGLVVRWHTRLYAAHPRDGDGVQLALDFQTGTHLIHCEVSVKEYPELKSFVKGRPITVVGRISEVDGMKGVSLDEVELTFPPP